MNQKEISYTNISSKKKGFTVIELVVSFGLTMLIVIFLFQVVVSLKQLYISSGVKTELLSKQSMMTKSIKDDFETKKIKYATNCGLYCINFNFQDMSSAQLKIDKDAKTFSYGEYTTALVDGSKFDNLIVSNESPVVSTITEVNKNTSFIRIQIPVKHALVKGDYGVNIVYQYNKNDTALSDIIFTTTDPNSSLYLKGLEEMVQFKTVPYVEPGYFVVEQDGSLIENDIRVTKKGSVGDTVGQTYTLTYEFWKNGKLVNTRTRKVTIIDSEYTYGYKGSAVTFTAPVDGKYEIELWGASGGDFIGASYYPQTFRGGNGAYTKGTISLNENEKIYLNVGGQGSDTKDITTGGYNGGGGITPTENIYGRAGGGATDARLIGGLWNNADSLKSRIMVAAGGGGGNNRNDQDNKARYGAGAGGAGGALTGLDGLTTGYLAEGAVPAYTEHALGIGGTQTAGGYIRMFTTATGAITNRTDMSGKFGIGSGVDLYRTQSGGGAGYYGGGASSHGGSGGGSSFISGHTGCNAINSAGAHTGQPNHYSGKKFIGTQMIAGNAAMPNPGGSGTITGRDGNGYARIKLTSVIN